MPQNTTVGTVGRITVFETLAYIRYTAVDWL